MKLKKAMGEILATNPDHGEFANEFVSLIAERAT